MYIQSSSAIEYEVCVENTDLFQSSWYYIREQLKEKVNSLLVCDSIPEKQKTVERGCAGTHETPLCTHLPAAPAPSFPGGGGHTGPREGVTAPLRFQTSPLALTSTGTPRASSKLKCHACCSTCVFLSRVLRNVLGNVS